MEMSTATLPTQKDKGKYMYNTINTQEKIDRHHSIVTQTTHSTNSLLPSPPIPYLHELKISMLKCPIASVTMTKSCWSLTSLFNWLILLVF